MKIKPIPLAKRVEKWQKRLTELGLAHWRVEEVIITDHHGMPNGPDTDASVGVASHYDSYRIWFNSDFLEATDARRLDETIVHELLHVWMRDMDEALRSVEDHMSSATFDEWDERVGHAREGMVESMARLIVRLYHKD